MRWGAESYTLAVRIYADRIVWLERVDPQWSDQPQEESRTLNEYLATGPPSFFEWHLLGESVALEIERVAKAIRRGASDSGGR